MTVLTATTGLLLILVIHVSFALNGFLIGYLRSTNVCFYLKFPQQTVNNDVQMQFAHTSDDGLTSFFVGISSKGRVFFCQLCQSDAHLFLTSLGLRFDCELNNRFWEFHGFQNDRILFVAEGITSCGILQTNSSSDITSIYGFDILSVVGMHLKNPSHSFSVILGCVQHGRTSVNSTRIYTEEAQLTNERVCCDLKCQSCERF